MSVDPSPILELIGAFRRSKAMFTAVSLGVFDHLSHQPSTAAALASALEADPDALSRLLDGCVSLGLLSKAGNEYSNTQLSAEYLVSTGPESLAGYILYSNQSLYPLWSHLEEAVREGTNRWQQTFGSRDALFDYYFRTEESKRSFLGGMHGFGRISSKSVAQTFDLGSFRHLADLGGATGHLSIAACQVYPHLRATVYDLPLVQDFAEEYISACSLGNRVRFVAGDFFVGELPPADLYALGRIIHDWSEGKIQSLLRKVFAALPSGGGLLIAEALMDDDHSGPTHVMMQSLNMLVCTEGKERTCSEYRSLLDAAGFRSIQCRRTGTIVDAVLARKP